MNLQNCLKLTVVLALCAGVSACGPRGKGTAASNFDPLTTNRESAGMSAKSSFWDIFGPSKAERTVNVNKYLWVASLDVLSFLPVQSVDPFTGVIVTGYGTPPGGGRAYRAVVHISDPALDARSLNVSLQTQGGHATSPATARAVEDAILTRARQLRVRDKRL
ncbi:DUF3576 domain-containing protein [Pseudodonghicola xiamenensis]|nr:DUF3576 domain-containing protein [Pseudodonghicola xiamenensis]